MNSITFVSYLRPNEMINNNITSVLSYLYKEYPNLSVIFFTDRERNDAIIQLPYKTEFVILPGTKYKRLKYLFERDIDDYIISIDNDMTVDEIELLRFVNKSITECVDIAWPRIFAKDDGSFIGKMIAVDKLLSHTVIRPLLWLLKIGISLPGQLFVIKPSAFKSGLLDADTFLDDLALGLYVNTHSKSIKRMFYNQTVGFEMPKTSFCALCVQRRRWAKGFYTICKGVKGKQEKKLIMWHGFAYHFLWIVNWMAVIVLCQLFSWEVGVSFYFLISNIISRTDMRKIGYALIYQVYFPIFHIIWFYYFLRGEKNNDNA